MKKGIEIGKGKNGKVRVIEVIDRRSLVGIDGYNGRMAERGEKYGKEILSN
nr:hypothetical protein [Paenibacillus bovis]